MKAFRLLEIWTNKPNVFSVTGQKVLACPVCNSQYFWIGKKTKKTERNKIKLDNKKRKICARGNCVMNVCMRMCLCVKLVWPFLRGTLSSWSQTYFLIFHKVGCNWPQRQEGPQNISEEQPKSPFVQASKTCWPQFCACSWPQHALRLGLWRAASHHLPTTSQLCLWGLFDFDWMLCIDALAGKCSSAVYKLMTPYTGCQFSLDKGRGLMDLHNEWISLFCNSAKQLCGMSNAGLFAQRTVSSAP